NDAGRSPRRHAQHQGGGQGPALHQGDGGDRSPQGIAAVGGDIRNAKDFHGDENPQPHRRQAQAENQGGNEKYHQRAGTKSGGTPMPKRSAASGLYTVWRSWTISTEMAAVDAA